MSLRGVGAIVLTSVLTLGACGTTYIDSAVTVPDTADVTSTTTRAPVVEGAPLDELLVEIETLMFDLDERIIDQRGEVTTMERIDQVWREAERQIRNRDADDVFNFEQAIELARSGVDRRRPADASKGYKILVDVVDAYLTRPAN